MKIRIGIICPSEIAFRRFMPAVKECENFEYVGVAAANAEEWGGTLTCDMRANEIKKAQNFVDTYGGKIFESYTQLIESDEVDAIYLPLPPALHYKWGKLVLENGKHLFLEKPSTTSESDTKKLVKMAKEKGLALHENYMFQYHSQIEYIKNMIADGKVGDLRLLRIAFGFPQRAKNDFRYNKALGGGALLDCGGYTVKLASIFLGNTAKITTSQLNFTNDFDVDIFGSATMVNDNGLTAQLTFGMDNSYKCDLEVWGSQGTIFANRILTAPAGFEPTIEYKNGNEPVEKLTLSADDTFKKSILFFGECVESEKSREYSYVALVKQSELVEKIKERQ